MANPVSAIGLMSGTSMDGIDVGWLRTDGEDMAEILGFVSYPYSAQQREMLSEAMQLAQGLNDRGARPGKLAHIERELTRWHADAIDSLRKKFPASDSEDSIIGFHGQTVLHRPEQGLTVQLGDGQLLADLSGSTVVADMRANDMVHGGQGAPMACAWHKALAQKVPELPVAFVNIGGVGNVTFVERDGSMLAFDTGPGNALMDDWCMQHTGKPVDLDGALARTGSLDEDALAHMRTHRYFQERPPKSLDRGDFTLADVAGLNAADGAATLAWFTAHSIVDAAVWAHEPPKYWVICGGGRKNRFVMECLASLVDAPVVPAEAIGVDGDAIEAEAWAYLAVRSLRALPLTWPGTTGVRESVTGGVVFKAGSGA